MTKFIKTDKASSVYSGRSLIHTSADYALVDNDGTILATICKRGWWRVDYLPANIHTETSDFAEAKILALRIHEQFTSGESMDQYTIRGWD